MMASELVTALVVCGASGATLLAAYLLDPNQDAARYYHEHHKSAYSAMKLCKIVLLAALVFNARYVLAAARHLVFQKVSQWTQ
jgi:hypothetical protein